MPSKKTMRTSIRRPVFLLALLIAFLTALYALRPQAALPVLIKKKILQKPVCERCNVVLISLDTLSGLHLPCYGYPNNTAPNLCSFASRNIFFTNANSQSYYTLPSHASLFTSQYPSTHGLLESGTTTLPPSSITLAESLKKAGYATLWYGPVDNDYLPLHRGLARGFTHIDTEYDYERANGLDNWKRGIDKLNENRNNGKPTFLFLHTYYVHHPYLPDSRALHFSNDNDQKIPVTKDEYLRFTPEFMQFTKDYFRQNPVLTKNLEQLYSKYITTQDHERARALYQELTNKDCKDYCLEAEYFYLQQKDNERDVAYMRALYDELIFQLDIRLAEILEQLKPMLSA